MISTTSYATKWYITLFANTVTFQTQLRIWDVFLLDGRDTLVITAVAIIWFVKGTFDISTCRIALMTSDLAKRRSPNRARSKLRDCAFTSFIILRPTRRRNFHPMDT